MCVVLDIMDGWVDAFEAFEAISRFVGVTCYTWGEMRMETVEARRGAYGNFPYILHSEIGVSWSLRGKDTLMVPNCVGESCIQIGVE